MTIRVLLADDQTMFRDAVSALLSLEEDIDVVAAVGRGDEVPAAVRRHSPDVALLDIEMPGTDGLATARLLRESGYPGRVAILTTFDRPGYLRGHGGRRQRVPAQGRAGLRSGGGDPADRRRAPGGRPGAGRRGTVRGASPLTQREAEVLAALRGHGTVAEIAARLHLSPGTVRNHLSAAIRKLGARTRAEALSVAEQKGWL